jgi:hypothetical protein
MCWLKVSRSARARILQFLELDLQRFTGAFCTGGTQS